MNDAFVEAMRAGYALDEPSIIIGSPMHDGEVTNDENRHLPDLTPREWVVITPVVAMAILMGLFPTFFLAPTAPAIDKLVERVVQTRQVNVDASSVSEPSVAHNQQSTIRNRQ